MMNYKVRAILSLMCLIYEDMILEKKSLEILLTNIVK